MTDARLAAIRERWQSWGASSDGTFGRAYAVADTALVDVPYLLARIETLERALNGARRTHYCCDDCWYSCPKSSECCCDEDQGDECNCGADEHNAKIDAALQPSEEAQ